MTEDWLCLGVTITIRVILRIMLWNSLINARVTTPSNMSYRQRELVAH